MVTSAYATLVGKDRTVTKVRKTDFIELYGQYLMSHVTRKPVFGVCDQVRLKPACSATGTSQGLGILDIASTDIILSKQRTTKALIRLRWCAGWSAPLLFAYGKNGFSHDAVLISMTLNWNRDVSFLHLLSVLTNVYSMSSMSMGQGAYKTHGWTLIVLYQVLKNFHAKTQAPRIIWQNLWKVFVLIDPNTLTGHKAFFSFIFLQSHKQFCNTVCIHR